MTFVKKTASHYFKLTSSVLLMLLILAGFVGCAGHTAKSKELLAVDYQLLNDEELLLYYYELDNQIRATEQRRSSPRVGFGLGLGNYGGRTSTSVGVGLSTAVDGRPQLATELLDQRNQVRVELHRRNLTP